LEDSMPASWAFLFWLLDALVEDFISPEAPHREETQISERSCPFGQGSTSKIDQLSKNNKSRGKREAKASEQSGFVNHQDGSSRDVDRTWKSIGHSRPFSRANEEGRLRGGLDGHFAKHSPPTFVGSPPSRTSLRESPERHQTRDSWERWRPPSSRQGRRRLWRDAMSGASTWGENARRRARCLASRCDRGRRRC